MLLTNTFAAPAICLAAACVAFLLFALCTHTLTQTQAHTHMFIWTLGANRFLFPAFFTWLAAPSQHFANRWAVCPFCLVCLVTPKLPPPDHYTPSQIPNRFNIRALLAFVVVQPNDFSPRQHKHQQQHLSRARRIAENVWK